MTLRQKGPKMSAKRTEERRAGGSATIAARGLERGGGEVNPGPPERFCVVGGRNAGDLSEEKIRALYKGNAWAQAVIGAILDRHRAAAPPPPYFWHNLRGGNLVPVRYADLGVGADGQLWLAVVDGRNRKAGIVLVNEERESVGEVGPLKLLSMNLPLPRDPQKAAEVVRRYKGDSNIHVPMAPTHNADRALEGSLRGESHFEIGVKLGLRAEVAEREVPMLLALSQCIDAIGAAVDDGRISIEEIAGWRNEAGEFRKTVADQETWLAKRLGPKPGRTPKGEGRPRALPASFAQAFAAQAAKSPKLNGESVALARFFAGDTSGVGMYPHLLEALGLVGWDQTSGTLRKGLGDVDYEDHVHSGVHSSSLLAGGGDGGRADTRRV